MYGEDLEFISNSAAEKGGAIFSEKDASIEWLLWNFLENTAEDGSVVYIILSRNKT